ncbi:MAG TPA: hypothetical protein PLI17_15425, partial [Denitromonas sp.]|nr:hypothetical protein [Denitromonas sp.]
MEGGILVWITPRNQVETMKRCSRLQHFRPMIDACCLAQKLSSRCLPASKNPASAIVAESPSPVRSKHFWT